MDADERRRLLDRSLGAVFDPGLWLGVERIIEDVRARGDEAISRALREFDGCEVPPDRLRIDQDEIRRAERTVSRALREAIRLGVANIRAFNERQLRDADWFEELRPGVTVGERVTPIESAGLFVPSGKASYPSVLMQLGTPAVVAGVSQIAVVVPPVPGSAGGVDPAVLAVAAELGLTEVFRVNGVAGIAGLAFGTETLPRVRKIVGPGSPPIVAAQLAVQRYGVATNVLMGPSESLMIADATADPDLVAADLLTEAEHGPDSASLLVTPSETLVEVAGAALERRLARLPEPRRSWAVSSLSTNGGVVVVADLDEAVSVANEYAPEHMVIHARDPRALAKRIVNAGEVLLGAYTPIAAANFMVGVPASLPTSGYARLSSGITARVFTKATSVAELDARGLAGMQAAALALARHEGFPAHAAALEARQL